ncbi:ABC transporter ATP-binding protein [Gracilimonas tropica]|uniref:ABC transporter ATP-binding protein n=1 Tax=Gracilimonas tropica TaxID=454600 RepID=UPI00036CE589|nr:ABC transporter ATP-binding protein [Gracilimonas tropica]
MKTVVKAVGVSKYFANVNALDNVDFEVTEGELFGVIGPDGAGKTTLFRLINTLLVPDEGSVTVLGLDSVYEYRKIRPLLGYMPGRFSLYQDLTVEENLNFFASVFGTTIESNYELIKPIYRQLEPFKTRLAGALSGGMKQKLALSCALIHKPRILLLDEPTTGVDAVSRKEFWEMLKVLKQEGITIIVSTPYMDEAKLCERVALIQDGKILQIDSPESIVEGFKKPLLGIKAKSTYQLLQALKAYPKTNSAQPFGEYVHYTEKNRTPDQDELRDFLKKQGVYDVQVVSVKPTIEDRFMELMDPQNEEENNA